MNDTAKYLIHADISANGVVERNDVVGAVFGQTEGLLGEELDIRGLRESSKVGRIDVDIESEGGRSFGTLTVESELDRTETAILAAALETIDRVGPCKAYIEVIHIEDARAAKREAVVDRAKELLATAFEETIDSDDIVDEVRESVRVAEATTYEGLPAGPRVAGGDAVILVEGRADVLRLLEYGIKNAVAVEGTDVPDAIGDLTADRTTTAFLDGDRGGDLILRELDQVAAVDYVARAPDHEAVEDLSREAVLLALREKEPLRSALADLAAPDDGEAVTERPAGDDLVGTRAGSVEDGTDAATVNDGGIADATGEATSPSPGESDRAGAASDGHGTVAGDEGGDGEEAAEHAETPRTLADHAAAAERTVRLLDDEFALIAEADAAEAIDAIEAAETVPHAVVVDGEVSQRLLDVAAQHGVARVVGSERGQFTKQPTAVRVHTATELR
jgi:DNA primase